MEKKGLKNKRKYIIILGVFLIVIIIYCIYNFVLNPRDLLGNRCKTFYNQSQYKLVNGDVIDEDGDKISPKHMTFAISVGYIF